MFWFKKQSHCETCVWELKLRLNRCSEVLESQQIQVISQCLVSSFEAYFGSTLSYLNTVNLEHSVSVCTDLYILISPGGFRVRGRCWWERGYLRLCAKPDSNTRNTPHPLSRDEWGGLRGETGVCCWLNITGASPSTALKPWEHEAGMTTSDKCKNGKIKTVDKCATDIFSHILIRILIEMISKLLHVLVHLLQITFLFLCLVCWPFDTVF